MERMSLEFDGKVAVLKFNHPEVLNAIGVQMLEDFNEALQTLKDPANGARCLLLTGEGRGFSAGANLQDDAGSERRGNSGDGLRSTYHPILLTLRDLEMPIVTAVNGAAAGVGMSFAMMGDIVCAQKARFSCKRSRASAWFLTAGRLSFCRAWWAGAARWSWRCWPSDCRPKKRTSGGWSIACTTTMRRCGRVRSALRDNSPMVRAPSG